MDCIHIRVHVGPRPQCCMLAGSIWCTQGGLRALFLGKSSNSQVGKQTNQMRKSFVPSISRWTSPISLLIVHFSKTILRVAQ
jgi:hypothetical protein